MNTLKKLFKPVLDRMVRMDKTFSLGLELGPTRLNLAQMELVAGKSRLRAMASMEHSFSMDEIYQDPKKLKALLKQAYAIQPFKGKTVVSCLPAAQIKIISLSFRPVEGQANEVPILAALRERLKGELDNLVVDFMILRQDETDPSKRDALVALAPRDKVMAHLELLGAAGLEVEALDIGPAALARLVCHAGAIHTPEFPLAPNVLLVNFGADSSFLTVIWGRRLMLDRVVEFSENRMFARLKQVLDMPQALAMRLLYAKDSALDDADEGAAQTRQMVAEVLRPEFELLLQEINKTLVYMASRTRGKSVDHLYLAGRVACYPGIFESLRQQLKVPVRRLDPVAVFKAENSGVYDDELGALAGMAVTTGLALRGVPEHGA